MQNISCKPATPEELPELLLLMQAFYAETEMPFAPHCRAAMEALLASPQLGGAHLIRVRGAAEIVGYFVITFGFSLERGGRTALLDELYVIPGSRGQKIGTMALVCAMSEARKNQCQALMLEVHRANERARRLYRWHGFSDGERDYLAHDLKAGFEASPAAPRP